MQKEGIYIHFFKSFLIYYSGICFSLTPGKLGELVKIRFLNQNKKDSKLYFGIFIFERLTDMAILVFISLLSPYNYFYILLSCFFIFFVISCIFFLIGKNKIVNTIFFLVVRLRLYHFNKWLIFFKRSVQRIPEIISIKVLVICLLLGFAAWLVLSIGVAFILITHIEIPFFNAVSLYPLSIITGAIMGTPSGIGTTEFISATILNQFVSFNDALFIAVFIRFISFWLQIFIGGIIYLLLHFSIIKSVKS